MRAVMTVPWRGWFHVNGNTYGTWLPGDPRGWRSRDHREHVEGDYRRPPPPGAYSGLYAHAQRSMRQAAVRLTPEQSKLAGQAMIERLVSLHSKPIAFSLDRMHFHLLARFSGLDVRDTMALAKKHAWFVLRERALAGTLWARGCRSLPVEDREHQVNVFRYIEAHAARGAWVWTCREGLYWLEQPGDGATS
jgi:hypothetical protein